MSAAGMSKKTPAENLNRSHAVVGRSAAAESLMCKGYFGPHSAGKTSGDL